MKTFETEKHNIPKGATHYWNESCSGFFAWWNDNTKEMLCPDGLGSWCRVSDVSDDILHEIPKPRTKTEFVKVNYGMEHFAAGSDLFSGRDLHVLSRDENYYKIKSQDKAVKASQDGRIYEKVETEIDERQEFIEAACEKSGLSKYSVEAQVFGVIFDSGKFKLVEK